MTCKWGPSQTFLNLHWKLQTVSYHHWTCSFICGIKGLRHGIWYFMGFSPYWRPYLEPMRSKVIKLTHKFLFWMFPTFSIALVKRDAKKKINDVFKKWLSVMKGLYPFSETNFQDFSRTQIDFLRTLKFTLTLSLQRPQCSFSLLSAILFHLHFISFTWVQQISRTFQNQRLFSRTVQSWKCRNTIPGLSRFSRTCTNPVIPQILIVNLLEWSYFDGNRDVWKLRCPC